MEILQLRMGSAQLPQKLSFHLYECVSLLHFRGCAEKVESLLR